jgi:RNA polymerase sigma-70 factor (ECF subfamily)
MVEVVKHRAEFDGRSAVMTWVCGIARHKVADHYRSEHREQRRRQRVLDQPAGQQPGPDPDDRKDMIVDTLRRLPEAHRIVLTFHYLDGLPVRGIASQIGRSESAVESLLARARGGFRRAWQQVQEESGCRLSPSTSSR